MLISEIYEITRRGFNKLVLKLTKNYDFIAPVKLGNTTSYEKIANPDEILYSELPLHNAKKFFFKKQESLFQIDDKKGFTQPKIIENNKILFGLRLCDLNAIKHQDMAFEYEFKDPYYFKRRENTLLFGLHCKKSFDEYCFCGSMGLEPFYDLMFYDMKNAFIVDTGSKKGLAFVRKYSSYFKKSRYELTEADKETKLSKTLDKDDISKLYKHEDWLKASEPCLACSACNILCPTCYCFKIYDEPDFTMKTGVRKRNWSSCQFKSFTKVAGGHIFREGRLERFKHRIYHQLSYFKERFGINLCTGCGRCIRGCPKRIDFIKIINEMK